MKIISKACLIIACFSMILVVISSSTFAWQNTNAQVEDLVITGVQSYNITPFKSIYITTPRTADYTDGYYTRSIQHQNVYSLSGKRNLPGEARRLTSYVTEVQNDWCSIRFGESDLTTRLWQQANNATLDKIGYLGLRTSDGSIAASGGLAYGQERGVNFDNFIYDVGIGRDYEIQKNSYSIEYADFIISKTLLNYDNVLVISPYYTDFGYYPTQAKMMISYQLIQKTELGEVITKNISEVIDNTSKLFNSYVDINGETYNCYYTHFDIGKHIATNIDIDTREYVQVAQMKINLGSHWEDVQGQWGDRPDKVEIRCNYYRPYFENYEEVVDPWETRNPLNILSIDYYNREDFNKGTLTIDTDGFTVMGEAIGGVADGIMQTQIFPGVTLWMIVLIPLSLGIVFATLRYFAGG